MVRRKKKSLKVGVSVLILILLCSIVTIVMMTKPVSETAYFYDEDLGIIETQYKVYNKWNKWMGVFQQAVTFAESEVDVGDTVSLTDEHSFGFNSDTTCGWGLAIVTFTGPTGSATISHSYSPTAAFLQTESFTGTLTVLNEGTYSSSTEYFECIINVLTGECSGGSTQLCSGSEIDVGGTVTAIGSQICDADNWNIIDTITGGYVEENDCDDVRTRCSTGYYVEDTQNNIASGEHDCELIDQGGDPECTDDVGCTNEICEDELCVPYECETDSIIELTCDDNSIIVTQNCVNMRLVDTGNTCPDVTTNDTTTDTNDTQSNTTDTIVECWQVSPITEQAVLGDGTCEQINVTASSCTGIYFTTEDECIAGEASGGLNYALILLISGILLAGGISGWIIYKRYKK